MPSLVCHHLRFDWPNGEPVFADLDATFPDGLTGLVGRNGSGKSTLLRLMAGDLVPAAGSVSGPGRIAYLPQQLVLQADRTVAAAIHTLFAGPALASLAALGARGDASLHQEVQLTSPHHYFFAKVLADGKAAVALVTRKTINLGMGWALLRSNLGKLEPLLR